MPKEVSLEAGAIAILMAPNVGLDAAIVSPVDLSDRSHTGLNLVANVHA